MTIQPLVFEPYFLPKAWGSRQLAGRLGKRLPDEGAFGESWEISGHPHHVSRVAEGPARGKSLSELCSDHPAEVYGRADGPARFPLLIKYLDCQELLSVQVHPNDDVARRLLGDESGKTEAWVVLAAEPGARIDAGLRPGVTRADLERRLEAGTVAECLHAFHPQPGDCVYIPAGTVHAVGNGVLLAEVQQTSDATFRLFDWNRLDRDGRPRELHLAQALESIDWTAGPVVPVKPEALDGLPAGVRGEFLVRCPYFTLERFRLNAGAEFTAETGMQIWMVVQGSARLEASRRDYRRVCETGETVLIPAAVERSQWTAISDAVLLAARPVL